MRHLRSVAAVTLAVTFVACAASPRQRPVSAGPVASGPETLEGVRKRLEGTWTLQSLTVASFEGQPLSIGAQGRMTLDGFGNLQLNYDVTDDGLAQLARAGIAMPSTNIRTDGRVAIDAQSHQIVYVDPASAGKPFAADLVDMRRNPFAIHHRRHFQFNDDGTLTLSTRYDTGKDAAVGKWKKGS
jgi:hypothetical protein